MFARRRVVLGVLLIVVAVEIAAGLWLYGAVRRMETTPRDSFLLEGVWDLPGNDRLDRIEASLVERTPTEVVASYVSALFYQEYGVAYDYLSEESRKAFEEVGGIEAFRRRIDGSRLDLGRMREEYLDAERAVVYVSLFEDPAITAICLVREPNGWKILAEPRIGGIAYPQAWWE